MYSTEFLTIGFIGEDAFKGCNANNGQQLTTPIKGINVIKYSYGSIRKVIVK